MPDLIIDATEDKDKHALENWEKWMKVRKEQSERLGKAMDTDPTCLLMNRDDKWALDHEKDVMLDAQLIKDYQCRCGKTGCPIFWRTTEPRRPGVKNLFAEVLFSPVKLTHENMKLSHLLEDGYVGHPRVILEEKGILGQKCLENSLMKWKESPYYQKRAKDLRKQIKEIQNFVPKVQDLVVIGKTVVQEKVVKGKYHLPGIIVEEYYIHHEEEDETIPILWIGNFLLKGGDTEGVHWTIEFTTAVPDFQAKYIKFTNKGQIAINYYWMKEEDKRNPKLPLRITKHMLSRFYFNKSGGILLPGQTFYQTFWFRSKAPGLFKEAWCFVTTPSLPKVCFFLEGVASMLVGNFREY